jgi:hypothetical protein
MFFRVAHEAVGIWPRGHVVQSDASPGVDFDRLVRLGAVAPISDDEADRLISTGQSPPPTVLPPLPPRGSNRQALNKLGELLGLIADGGGLDEPTAAPGPGPQGARTPAHAAGTPHPGDSGVPPSRTPQGPAGAPHAGPAAAAPAGTPAPPPTVTTGADHPPLTEAVDPKPTASADGGKAAADRPAAAKKADADKAK